MERRAAGQWAHSPHTLTDQHAAAKSPSGIQEALALPGGTRGHTLAQVRLTAQRFPSELGETLSMGFPSFSPNPL